MEKIEILIQILILITLILLIIAILYYLGTQSWAMQILKNKCVAECFEINKLNPYSCVC